MNLVQTQKDINTYASKKYKYGFETLIESDKPEKGLNEAIINYISAKKKEPQWMLDWRLKSYEKWKSMKDPTWANIDFKRTRDEWGIHLFGFLLVFQFLI